MTERSSVNLVAAVFVLSGFAALIYQVVWQRALFSIYGLDIESVTVVVTAFMLGLGLGSLAGGAVAARPKIDLLAAFALVEAAISAYGLGSLPLFAWVGELTGALGPAAVLFSTFVLVALPTALMGATLPMLVGHEVRRSKSVGRSLGTLYFANTLGGGVAAIAAGTALMPLCGLRSSVFIAACVNAAIAFMVLVIRHRDRSVKAMS